MFFKVQLFILKVMKRKYGPIAKEVGCLINESCGIVLDLVYYV